MLVRVAEASGGNPFYALEIAGALARGRALPALGDLLPVPRTLHDLLSDRVDRLSPPARAVASAAAALSRPTAEIVEAALGSDLDVDAALLEAEEAGVLVSDGDRLRFSHPLLASTIYGSLTAARRRALHRRLAAVVGDPEERARHLARSASAADEGCGSDDRGGGGAGDPPRRAGIGSGALSRQRARLTPAEQPEDLARRMLGGADALSLAGDLGGARSLATRALETGRDGIAPSARALAARLPRLVHRDDRGPHRLPGARARRGRRRSSRCASRSCWRSSSRSRSIRTRPRERADEAIGLLRERDDQSPLARALISKFIAEAVLGRGAR